MTRSLRPLAALALLLLVLPGAGCNPYTYVNVPPQSGDVARHGPNQELVREVEVEAIRSLLSERPLDPPVAVELPVGTNELTTSDVARRSGEGVLPVHEAQEAASLIKVTQVRIRGPRAQVDLMYPTLTGMSQLLTVYMSYTPINGWQTERIVDWPGVTQPVDHGGTEQP
ncbi:MAG: hypothetical protein IT445_06535 [Phycisphaeraceae bacterium]|nr:hypothetical protein [Phycisphaeraceae bacterium]